jgi:hypothetical protein
LHQSLTKKARWGEPMPQFVEKRGRCKKIGTCRYP